MMITIEDLTKRYGAVTALHQLSFELQPGIVGLVGANGAQYRRGGVGSPRASGSSRRRRPPDGSSESSRAASSAWPSSLSRYRMRRATMPTDVALMG